MTDSAFFAGQTGARPLPAGMDLGSLHVATQVIEFTLDDHLYGVDIMAVREIKEWSNVVVLPNQPDYVRGVLDLRGAVVPIVDLRCRFGQGMTEPTPRHIVIIIQIDDQLVGIMGDRVLDIVEFDAGDIKPVPHVGIDPCFLSGIVAVDGVMIALIDLLALIPTATRNLAKDITSAGPLGATRKTQGM